MMKKKGRPSKVKEVKDQVVSKVEDIVKAEDSGGGLLVGDRVEGPDGEGNILEVIGSLVKVIMENGVVNNYNEVVLKKK